MRNSTQPFWRTIQFESITWPDGAVIYNPESGETHLLSTSAAHILYQLRTAPADAVEIARQLTEPVGIQVEPDLLQRVETLLCQLEALDLVVRESK